MKVDKVGQKLVKIKVYKIALGNSSAEHKEDIYCWTIAHNHAPYEHNAHKRDPNLNKIQPIIFDTEEMSIMTLTF